jgi:trimeric autotransporter adhesin
MKKLCLIPLVVLLQSAALFSQTCPNGLSGTFKIGPTGNFSTIQAAMDTLKSKGVTAAVILELQSTYNSSVETFPIRLSLVPCADSTKYITLRPETGAANLEITGNDDTTTIDLNNAHYFVIDGRSGGIGVNKNLTISNTNTNGSVIRFIDDACFNSIAHVNIKGGTSSIYHGLVDFDGTSLISGNDYNRIDTCNIFNGATAPANGIHANGTPGKTNTGILINGCSIYNFFKWGDYSNGIFIRGFNDSVAIVGNSIYHTADRIYTHHSSSHVAGIKILAPFNGGFLVTNNFIGGTADRAGGNKWKLSGNFTFTGISVSNGSGAKNFSVVSNNIVTNLHLQSTRSPFHINMIELACGYACTLAWDYAFNGDCHDNIIGSPTNDSAIFVENNIPTNEDSWGTITGLLAYRLSHSDSVNIHNNKIGGMHISRESLNLVRFCGMQVNFDTEADTVRCSVRDNIIGAGTSPDNIYIGRAFDIYGIVFNNAPWQYVRVSITGNTVKNITSQKQTGDMTGIFITATYKGTCNVTGNRIHNLTAGERYLTGIVGMSLSASKPTLSISGNTIYGLSSIGTHGIYLEGSQETQIVTNISRNFIHSFWNPLWGPANMEMTGIRVYTRGTPTTIDNNMIRLGNNKDDKFTTSTNVFGIHDVGGTNTTIHNSVYLNGTLKYTASGGYSACYFSYLFSNPRVIRNNIFVNQRLHETSNIDSRNYCMYIYPPALDVATINNNLYYTDSGKVWTTLSRGQASLTEWQNYSGKDTNSIFANPNFKNPEGDTSHVDLHINYPSPVNAAGFAGLTTIADFDGDIRAGLSPVDIGADAGGGPTPPPPPVPTDLSDLGIPGFSAIVYPNPTKDNIYLQIESPLYLNIALAIYDITGQRVFYRRQVVMQGKNLIPLHALRSLPAGSYMLTMETGKKRAGGLIIKR